MAFVLPFDFYVKTAAGAPVCDQACPNYGLPFAKCSAAAPLAVRKGFAFPAPGNPPNPVFLGREG